MALFKKINDDMKAAMKSGDKARLEVLRFTLAGLNAAQKEKTLKDPQAMLSDENTKELKGVNLDLLHSLLNDYKIKILSYVIRKRFRLACVFSRFFNVWL